MLRLLEITFTDKETAAIYDSFADETALVAEYETKLGAAMKTDAYKAEYLLAFDEKGKIYAEGYTSKDDTINLSLRLIWVTATSEGETANQSKENDKNTLVADYHTKKGSAMKKADTLSNLLMGFDGKSVIINDYWSRPTA